MSRIGCHFPGNCDQIGYDLVQTGGTVNHQNNKIGKSKVTHTDSV